MRYAILKRKDGTGFFNIDIWFLVNRTSSDENWEIEYSGDSENFVYGPEKNSGFINIKYYIYNTPDDNWDYRECTKDEWEQEIYLINV
jgi:hypothetical protein